MSDKNCPRLRNPSVKAAVAVDYADPLVAAAAIEELGYGSKTASTLAGVLLELRVDGEAETKKALAVFKKIAGLTRKPNSPRKSKESVTSK